MAEFKAKTADGRGLTFDISGPSPTPQEQAEINAHVQNYDRLFPVYTQAAPVPAEQELGPWGAGWRNLYADTESAASGILQGLGAPEMAQRFEEDANRVRRETAERYKPLAFSDINNLSDLGTFAYQTGVGSLPYMIPGLIGGGIAGLGVRALGGAAAAYAPAAAMTGYAGATAPTRIGGIASRMSEEQGVPLSQIDWTKAVATGAASTALDLVTPQVLGVFGKFAGAAKLGDEAAAGAINSWWKSLPKNVIKASATEAGTETAQQAMEIWAANPEKFYELGPDVREELITSAVAALLVGPIFEVATGGFAAEESALANAREKRRKAQEALDALIMQGDAANAEQIRQMREAYSQALAEEKAFSESDQPDVPFGPDTPRYRPSDDMGRYRAEVIVSDQGTPAGYRVAGPTGESIEENYPSFDAARMAAQVLNDSAPHSPSIMESYPVIPTSSLSASTREALVKKRFEMGQVSLEANTSMTEIRNLLGDAIATLERERLTGAPDIPLQARMVAPSSPASTAFTPNIPPPVAPPAAPAVAPETKKAAKTLKPRTEVVKTPVEVNPETATPTAQQPSAAPTEPDLNAMTDDELEAYLAEGAGEFTFAKGELGQKDDVDYARRRRSKQGDEATVAASEQRPAPTGPRFTVQPVDATVKVPEGVPSGAVFEIFKDGKVIGSSSNLAQAQERARNILQKSPTANVRVRPKGRAYAVNEYRGSANGDIFVSTVRTFRDRAEADTYADTLNKMREERAQKRAANQATIKRYEDLVAKQQAVVQRLMSRLRDLGMTEDFRLLIRGVLQDPTKAVEDINIDTAGDTGIEGYYDAAAKTIGFAMNLYSPNLTEDQLYAKLEGVINHEFVHALQRAGAFTPAEWKAISKYLKSNQAYGRDGEKIPGQTWWERAEQMYGAQDQERVAREAMSEAFRSWARERKTVTGKPAGVFRRIVEMLKSLGRFGKTTPRVEQIFSEINQGKRGDVLRQGAPAGTAGIDLSGGKSNLTKSGGQDERPVGPERAGDRRGRDQVGSLSPLPGAPVVKGATGPDPDIVEAARYYASSIGRPLRRQAEYVEVDPERAARIADAYESMPHAPQDPKVREAYADLIRQTKAQYQALVDSGYSFTFFDSSTDPYNGNLMNAVRDLRANKRMAVYGTYDGFGTEGVTGAAIENNPMLEDTGLTWLDQNGEPRPVTANDLFRAVHDAFGHSLEGAGFRARGEENAWQAHIRMYYGPAVGAATSELRGQNSWLNYGPYGERNRNAQLQDTVFAEQKTGLMPEWTWKEGLAPDEIVDFVVPEEVRKPNGDIDFSKRNLRLDVEYEKESKRQTYARFYVRMNGSDQVIGKLEGHVSRKDPEVFQVEWASFSPDDMSLPETYGLIGHLLKRFPQVRKIKGYRASGAKAENRARRIAVADGIAKRAHIRFASNIMTRAEASSDPVEQDFFQRYVGARHDVITDAAQRQVPELFEDINEARAAFIEASEALYLIQQISLMQTVDVGRLIDRGAIDFSRRKGVIAVTEKRKAEKLSRDERMENLAEKFKSKPNLFEVASNVYGETLYIKKEITDAVPGIRDLIPFLRADEIGLTNAKGAQGILEMFATVPSSEEMAAVAISGRAKRGWYERSAKALIDIFGPKDAPRFSALLAAMSPQSSVESNARNALNMWVNWDRAGRPADEKRILQIMGKSVQGTKGEKSALDSWKPNTLTALQTLDPHAITISGNKVNSFMLNLNDVVHAVTNDAWMANYGGVDQNKFTGPGYHGYSAKVRMAADVATQISGYKWTPREIQETIWSWAKTVYELRKRRGKGGGNESVGDLLRAGNVTNQMISNTPDFATLFANGVYRNILQSGGYGAQIEGIMSDERIESRGGQTDGAFDIASVYDAEGTGIDQGTYRAFIDTAAGRLEALYQRRKAEAAAKRAKGEKLSEEGDDADIDYSRRITSTLDFQDWFGLSKVVDASGDPIIVYHGTSKDNDFAAFNIPRNGAWFTASPDDASSYAKNNDSRKLVLGANFKYIEKNTADRVIPVYLRIEKPYTFTDADRDSLNSYPDPRDTGVAYRRWQAEFFDKLRRDGYDGVDMGYGTWVVLGEPNQIKSAIGNNGKFDPAKKRIDYSRRTLPVTPADIANAVDRLRYTKVRNGIARALRGVTVAGKRIGLSDEAAMGVSRSFLDNFADHALPLGEIADFVRENKGSIPDAFDAYLAQQTWSSEATDHINRTNDRLYNPLVRAIQNLKISDNDYNDFKRRFPSLAKVVDVAGDRRLGMLNALLYARHAPERNIIMNLMNEGNLKSGSGVPTPEAEAAIKWFESRNDWPKLGQAEGIIRQIVADTNNVRVQYGLTPDFTKMPPPEIFKKAGMPEGYKFYVPLRGIIEEDMMPNDIDLQRLRTGLGFKIKGKEDMTAMGRDTLAKSVAEHVILQNEVAIVRAHKNKVGRSFYNLVASNQGMLKGIARIVQKAPLVRRVGDDGIVRMMVDPNYMNSDRFFVTKINGENKVVEIFDKRLARTLNGSTGYGSDAANQIINFIGGFTRLMSQLATGMNPEFWIRNTPRDVMLAGVNLNQFEIPGLDITFMKNVPGAFKTVRRSNRIDWNFVKTGEERVPSGVEPDDILYKEFLEDGGFTGYLGLQDIESRIADLNKQITKGEEQGLQKGIEIGKRFAQFVEGMNNNFENMTRFAVYKSLRESGFSRQRSAQGAKTITTNFNAGGWYKNMINPFYMFYNASLQGTIGILTALGRSKRVQKIAGSIMIAGFLQDLLMSSLSDEDDTGALKYDGIKEYILRTHMVFADPTGVSGDGYIKIPMPYGYNAIFNFGRVLSKYIRHQVTGGDYDLGKAIGSAVGTLADATNPLGATNSFLNFIAPTFLDPVVDLTTNRDFADRTIVKRPFGVGVDLPSSQLHLNSTSPTFVSIADWLNSVTGGTDVMPGMVDFSPDAMQYLYDYFLSGAGAFVRRSFDLTTQGLPAALQGDLDGIQMSEVPMIRALVTKPTKVDMERYMEIRDEVMRIGKEAQEASRQSDMQRLENVREKYGKQLQVYGVVKASDSQRASINKRLAAIRENEKLAPEAKINLIKQLKAQEEAAMIRAIRAYNSTVEGMSVPGMEQ